MLTRCYLSLVVAAVVAAVGYQGGAAMEASALARRGRLDGRCRVSCCGRYSEMSEETPRRRGAESRSQVARTAKVTKEMTDEISDRQQRTPDSESHQGRLA